MAVSAAVEVEMETRAEEEKVSPVETEATLCSQDDESCSKADPPEGVILSGIEKRKRLGGARRLVGCYLRKMSPFRMLRKFRDCYVATLGSCAQNYAINYDPSYGCHASPLPPSSRISMRNEDLLGSEICLSPAFKKSFHESLLVLKSSPLQDSETGGSSPFRKSFSDYESCLSPAMKRTYSDAETLYSRSPRSSRVGCCRRSPGWTPTRALGGQAMMIFPIEEAPEVILASFRKEAQELRLASFRKDYKLEEGAELRLVTTVSKTAVSNLNIKELPDSNHRSIPSAVAF